MSTRVVDYFAGAGGFTLGAVAVLIGAVVFVTAMVAGASAAVRVGKGQSR